MLSVLAGQACLVTGGAYAGHGSAISRFYFDDVIGFQSETTDHRISKLLSVRMMYIKAVNAAIDALPNRPYWHSGVRTAG